METKQKQNNNREKEGKNNLSWNALHCLVSVAGYVQSDINKTLEK